MNNRIAMAVTLDETVSGDFDRFFFNAYTADGVSRDLHAYSKRATKAPPLEDKDRSILIGSVLRPGMLSIAMGFFVPYGF